MSTYKTNSKLDVKMNNQGIYSGSTELVKQLDNMLKIYPSLKEHVENIYLDSIEKYRLESNNLTEIEFRDELKNIICECHFRYIHHLATGEYTYSFKVEDCFKAIYEVYIDKGAKEINNILDQFDKADIFLLEAYKIGVDISLPMQKLKPPSQKGMVMPKYPGLG